MTIADLSVMEVEVEVDETDVVGLKIGQLSEVRVDAFPNKTIKGKVTEIGSSALLKLTSSEESKDFKVVITLENPPENLKPGLSASADIITARKKRCPSYPDFSFSVKRKRSGRSRKRGEARRRSVSH